MDDTRTGLPRSIKAAWGLRERPRKGPKPELSFERIVAAGVQVAGSSGLDAVSMSRVAAELGASPMSLYRYVSSKDELLALMVDAAYGAPPARPVPFEGWRAGLASWALAERAVLRHHPWVLRVPITGPPITPNQIAWFESGLDRLADTALAESQKVSALLLLTGYVRSSATLDADLAAAFGAASPTTREAMSAYGQLLAKVTDAQHFPAVHRAIAAGVFDAPDDPDAEFLFGLERLFDGIDALMRAQ